VGDREDNQDTRGLSQGNDLVAEVPGQQEGGDMKKEMTDAEFLWLKVDIVKAQEELKRQTGKTYQPF